MKTIKSFIEQSHIDGDLIRAVVRQSGGWNSFREDAAEIAQHGADAGWNGFVYYGDTVKFARKHRDAITAMAADMAQSIGDGDEYQLIAGFNCLRNDELTAGQVAKTIHTGRGDDVQSIFNALAWFALEEVARSYSDLTE